MAALKPLNAQQEAFCQEFLVDLKAGQAARRAGYAEKFVRAQATRMMKLPHIRARIDALVKERAARTGHSGEEVVARLWRLADRAEMENDFGAERGALELLCRHYGLLHDKVQHEGSVIVEICNPYARPVEVVVDADQTHRLS